MLKLKHKDLVTGEELTPVEIQSLLDLASDLKAGRKEGQRSKILEGKHLAMLFEKPSLRTRFSFMVAMHELGGSVVESLHHTRKEEEPEDLAKVLSGYCHAIMIRTHSDENLQRMAKGSSIPIINALSDDYHPCQILADLMTLQENFGLLRGIKVTYIGDGNNILHTLLLMTPIMGIDLHYCCPMGRNPKPEIVGRALVKANLHRGSITAHTSPRTASMDAHAVYTDVWTSMGFEKDTNEALFAGFQVNEELMGLARAEAIFMHCMPMVRGKEVSTTLPDSPQSVIFQQSENRLHVQKALLIALLGEQI
jgi:ornithine carbamoyltransferase